MAVVTCLGYDVFTMPSDCQNKCVGSPQAFFIAVFSSLCAGEAEEEDQRSSVGGCEDPKPR